MARFRDKPLDFQPGEDWRYSNSNYVLLGYLIEKITGQRYQDFVEENLFNPLGMQNSGYDSNTAIIPAMLELSIHFADPHLKNSGKLEVAQQIAVRVTRWR